MKKYDEAIKCYDKAIEMDSDKLYITNRENAKKKLDELLELNI